MQTTSTASQLNPCELNYCRMRRLCLQCSAHTIYGSCGECMLCSPSLRQTPTFNADVRTRLLDQEVRPFDLNTSPDLREFILASHLRLRLVDFFVESTTLPHRYYSILEITVAARYSLHCTYTRDTDIEHLCLSNLIYYHTTRIKSSL